MHVNAKAVYTMSKKTVQNYFRQNFVKFPPTVIFWHNDDKEAKIMRGELIFQHTQCRR